jgi:7-cyano-7-deazaguanine synthase
VGMDKTSIVQRGVELRVPLELTWSCYVGGAKHCGKCGTCVERKEAFVRAGVKDPTDYLA